MVKKGNQLEIAFTPLGNKLADQTWFNNFQAAMHTQLYNQQLDLDLTLMNSLAF